MNTTGLNGLSSLYFGERYKSKKKWPLSKVDTIDAGSGVAAISMGTSSLALPTAAAPVMSIISGVGGTAWIGHVKATLGQFDPKKPAEPEPEPPEVKIRKALEQLDTDRQKQHAIKESVCKTYVDEFYRLRDLKAALDTITQKAKGKILTLAEELKIHEKSQEVEVQERTVGQMKLSADMATALDLKYEAKMQELKQQYLTMKGQLQQLEHNKKLLEMQKSLDQLKGADFQSPETQNIKEQLESELEKSTVLVESFLQETEALSHLREKEQTALIEQLKAPVPQESDK